MNKEDIFKLVVRNSCEVIPELAMVTLNEAWDEANLEAIDPSRIGLVVGGSNIQQRDLVLLQPCCK